MRQFVPILAVITVLLIWPGSAGAQESVDTVGSLSGVEITTSVDRAESYVGDLIQYTLTITYDSSMELIPPPLGANLGLFDVKDYNAGREEKLPGGRRKNETVFTLSTFTTGDYLIPPVPILLILPDSSHKILLSESVPIKVLSMLDNAGETVDIKPLKEQYEFPRNWTMYFVWGGVGLAVIAAAIMLIMYLRRRRQLIQQQIDSRPPWEIAFEKLAVLKEKRYIDDGRYKPYYFELTELIREYLGRMYMVDVLEMTTGEYVESFASLEMPGDLYPQTLAFFNHADLVKFARHQPTHPKAEDDFLFAHDVVESVRHDFQRRAEPETHVSRSEDDAAPVATGGGQ